MVGTMEIVSSEQDGEDDFSKLVRWPGKKMTVPPFSMQLFFL